MAKGFRLWHKKRGDRRTNPELTGAVGEAIFFSVLLVLGLASFAALVASRLTGDGQFSLAPGFGFWLMVTVLGSFVVIGGVGVVMTLLKIGTSDERRSAIAKRAVTSELFGDAVATPKNYPTLPSDQDFTNSPGIKLAFRLPTAQSPVWQLSAASIFCFVWCVLTVVMLIVAYNSRPETLVDWLLTMTVLPFVAVAGWSIRHFVQQWRLHTGIGPTIVEVSSHPLFPGQSYQVYVSQAGRLKMKLFEMFLVCEEEATYHQGTDVRADRCVIHEQLVFRREDFVIDHSSPFEYQCLFSIPDQAMHSFQSPHNRVIWKLVAKGNAVNWPVFFRSFPVIIYPPKPTTAAAPVLRSVDQVHV